MCCDYDLPDGIFPIGQEVKLKKSYFGWFDFSIKKEIPPNTVGTIFKIEKMSVSLEDVEYTVQFDQEFGFVKIKHGDLENV